MNDAKATTTTRPCHVLYVDISKTTRIDAVSAPTLPPETVTRLRRIVAAWRWHQSVARDLQAVRRTLAPAGLLVWYALSNKRLKTPTPLCVPIEPMELDEGRAPLADLIEDAIAADPKLRKTRWWRRVLTRIGVPLIIFASNLPNAIAQLILHHNLFTYLLWTGILTMFVAIAVLIYLLAEPWYIVPGGVMVRRTFAGKPGASMTYFARSDSVLVIRPGNQGHTAQLWREGAFKHRQLTPLELAALLAAWTSPLMPPPAERLSDWQ